MARKRLIAAVAVLASAVMLMSCSESVDDDGASPTDGGTDAPAPTERTTRGITDTSIKVGGIQYGVYFGDASVGVEARINKANADGGIHGRTIEFVGAKENDNDTTKDQDLARSLVEQDGVFALLPVMAGTFGAGDYVVENNVPMFGYGINPAFCGNDVAFGITGCVTNPSLEVGSNALGTALEDFFDGDTDKSISFIAEDNDARSWGSRPPAGLGRGQGLQGSLCGTSAPGPAGTGRRRVTIRERTTQVRRW